MVVVSRAAVDVLVISFVCPRELVVVCKDGEPLLACADDRLEITVLVVGGKVDDPCVPPLVLLAVVDVVEVVPLAGLAEPLDPAVCVEGCEPEVVVIGVQVEEHCQE